MNEKDAKARKIQVRVTKESESLTLCNIQKAAFLPLYDKYQDQDNPCFRGVEDIAKRLNSDSFRYFTIYLDEEIVGGALYKCKGGTPFVEDLEKGHYYLQRIYIKPEHQCKGIAQTAILLCEKMFPNAICFWVDFPEDLAKNERCYTKVGFLDTGERLQIQSGLVLASYKKVLPNKISSPV